MYKTASRLSLRSHKVDAPLPTGGYIGEDQNTEDDYIKTVSQMSLEECVAEIDKIGVETIQMQAHREDRKRNGATKKELSAINSQISLLGTRKSHVKQRQHFLIQDDQPRRFAVAIKELCTPEIAQRILDYANRKTTTP